MVNPLVHQHVHHHVHQRVQQRAQVEAQRDIQFRPLPAVRAPVLDDTTMTKEEIFAVAEDYNDRLTCPVCMANKVNTVLMPCGHLVCSTCAPRLITENGHRCPKCSLGFSTMHNIYYKKYLKYKNKYLALKRDI